MKQLIGNGDGTQSNSYIFDAANSRVTIIGLPNLIVENILLINNVTRNVLIYNPFISGTGFTSFNNGVLTLVYDTTTHSNSDKLQIFYDDSDELNVALTDMSNNLKSMFNVIASPMYYDQVTGGLRIGSGTLTSVASIASVTSVTLVTSIGQFGGMPIQFALTNPLKGIEFNEIRDRIITT